MSEAPCFNVFSGGRPLNLGVKLSPPKFRGYGLTGQVQIGKPPRLKPPRLAALELQVFKRRPVLMITRNRKPASCNRRTIGSGQSSVVQTSVLEHIANFCGHFATRFATLSACENGVFGPPARNWKRLEKYWFWPPPENRKKLAEKKKKNAILGQFLPIFQFLRLIFSCFLGEAKPIFFPIVFSYFGPEARKPRSSRRTGLQCYLK